MPSTEGNKTSVNLRIYVSRLRRRLANSRDGGAVVAVMWLILHASGHRKYVLASPLRFASRNIHSLLRRNENEHRPFLSSSLATRLTSCQRLISEMYNIKTELSFLRGMKHNGHLISIAFKNISGSCYSISWFLLRDRIYANKFFNFITYWILLVCCFQSCVSIKSRYFEWSGVKF